MSLADALAWVTALVSWAGILFGLEIFLLAKSPSFSSVWSLRNLSGDFKTGLPLPWGISQKLFSNSSLRLMALLQMLLSLVLVFSPSWVVVIFLIGIHLMICIRFRGTYNGGSDMMMFVVLTGLLISYSSESSSIQRLGLIYIALHAGYSYVKASLVKVKEQDWRSGKALPVFLERSLFQPTQKMAIFFKQKSVWAKWVSWIVIVFEISLLSLFWFPSAVYVYGTMALAFHFGNYVLFGLNRFFWIWLSAWPALVYAFTELSH